MIPIEIEYEYPITLEDKIDELCSFIENIIMLMREYPEYDEIIIPLKECKRRLKRVK